MGKATGWGDFQKNWYLEHPSEARKSLIIQFKTLVSPIKMRRESFE